MYHLSFSIQGRIGRNWSKIKCGPCRLQGTRLQLRWRCRRDPTRPLSRQRGDDVGCSSFEKIYSKPYTIFQQPCWWNWWRGRSVGRSIYDTRRTNPSNSLWLKNLSLSSYNKACADVRGLDIEARRNIHRSQLYVRECTKVKFPMLTTSPPPLSPPPSSFPSSSPPPPPMLLPLLPTATTQWPPRTTPTELETLGILSFLVFFFALLTVVYN